MFCEEFAKILLDNRKVANVFSSYFQSIFRSPDLFERPNEPKLNIFDEIDIIIKKFWSQTSIAKLKQKFSFKRKFAFKPVRHIFVKNIVNDLSRNKAAGEDIPLNLFVVCSFVPCTLH